MNRLHSKSFTVTSYLATYFISVEKGSRINTVSDFSKRIEVGMGTIQSSLKVLKDSKAINLISRGQLGTFLKDKDITKLLKFANIESLVGVMPLPYTKLYEGLSTGIIENLSNSLYLPTHMAYMRGAKKRIEMVNDGLYAFAIVSKFAALEFLEENPGTINILINFGPNSFLTGHHLVLYDDKYDQIEDGMRVAIDYDSIDQYKLTLKACENKDVTFVPMSYSNFYSSLDNNEIDCMIWNSDENTSNLKPYKTVMIDVDDDSNTEAVLVAHSDRVEIISLIDLMLDKDKVLTIQKEVVAGQRIPQY